MGLMKNDILADILSGKGLSTTPPGIKGNSPKKKGGKKGNRQVRMFSVNDSYCPSKPMKPEFPLQKPLKIEDVCPYEGVWLCGRDIIIVDNKEKFAWITFKTGAFESSEQNENYIEKIRYGSIRGNKLIIFHKYIHSYFDNNKYINVNDISEKDIIEVDKEEAKLAFSIRDFCICVKDDSANKAYVFIKQETNTETMKTIN